jgi:hypothetical protein
MSHSYNVTVTSDNVFKILSAGKKEGSSTCDLNVLQELQDKENELDALKGNSSSFKPSKLGSAYTIELYLREYRQNKLDLKEACQRLASVQMEWVKLAQPLFMKACYANLRILVGMNGVRITVASSSIHNKAGVYTSAEDVDITTDMTGLDKDDQDSFLSEAKALSTVWEKYFNANKEAWDFASKISDKENNTKYTTLAEALKAANKIVAKYENELGIAKRNESYNSKLNDLESNVKNLRRQCEKVRKNLSEIDPILTTFGSQGKGIKYDSYWIDSVHKAALNRTAMPYLPISWNGKTGNVVFDWQKAINDGTPNLCIEADTTTEGTPGKMAMLDTFLATMILAFPVKQVHITVLECRTVNTFVDSLHSKIYQKYDIATDDTEIKSFVKELKDMYRNGRNNPSPDCCPREIVVIAGFDQKGNNGKFTDLLMQLSDVIEYGKCAGIYFVVVLTKDITEYEEEDFEDYDFAHFCPYCTILTNKQDKDGYSLPDYNLLDRDASIQTDEGIKSATLSELIKEYIDKEVFVIPNKVYDLIANGELYNTSPICDLNKQPKKDVGKIVAPIAQTENGELLNLRFDDEEYLFCFILGRSGMGKSFTLHTILTNLMLKYDPSVVDFILMDFKPGGVELNYYKDVPHVSKLLVNGADTQVAQEILTSILKEMEYRGDLFQKSGEQTISRYNTYASKNGLKQMKHIILLVDECQDLFKLRNTNSDTSIITEIARKGRSYGVHMVLATQTLKRTDIPSDALGQFSDFLFMGCDEYSVNQCGISDNNVQRSVEQLVKGEVIYCHRGAEPIHGYVFNYYGKNGVYSNKTHASLLSSRFSHPDENQFYFNASQIYKFDKQELRTLCNEAQSGLRPIPMAVLGKNLSVQGNSLYAKFGNSEGANLLILGTNNLLQGERVLWNALISLYKCNKVLNNESRYFILPNIPEDVEADARDVHQKRMRLLRSISNNPGINLVEDSERFDTIERVAATVRGRKALEESNRQAIRDLDSIYLIIPNQQLFYTKMAKRPRGLKSLDTNLSVSMPIQEHHTEISDTLPTDDSDIFGSNDLIMPGSEPESPKAQNAPDFGTIDLDFYEASGSISVPSANISDGQPGRDFNEELQYILGNGPSVKVHVMLQTTNSDKIYAGDNTMRANEMTLFFNDIVFLKMLRVESLPLSNDDAVQKLNSDPKSLRAIVYNYQRGERTIVPFDIPD